MTQGVCRNASCANASTQTPVDRYPGPGEYCPLCGDELEPLPAAAPPPAPFDGLSPLQALQRFDDSAPAPQPQSPPRRRSRRRSALVLATVVVCVGAATGAITLHPASAGRPSGDTLYVCRSSMNDRLAADVVSAFRAKNPEEATRIELSNGGGPCDVRFSVAAAGEASDGTIVGRDGIVVVVNPQNPVVRLTAEQVRKILSGELTDWSQVGTGSGAIVTIVPADGTDEGTVLAKRIMQGVPFASGVRRAGSTADVVALVASAQGRNAIGIAAFSGSVPAKVVRLGAGVPSALSIGEQRYPLTVGIAVEAAGASPPPAATQLIRYARSDEAQPLVAQDGLVPRKGY